MAVEQDLLLARTIVASYGHSELRDELMFCGGTCEDDPSASLRIKTEIDAHETSPARDPIRVPFAVDTPWFHGTTSVLTFTPEELVATKLRALYQRSKGRGLVDLWLAIK